MAEKTNHYIRNVLNLGYSINCQKHNSIDPEQWLRLHDENNDIDVRLSDIGVGIAQVIPVIVGALDDSYSPRVFAVEQPELHVHPAVQVALGDVFIDSIKNIKSSDYSNNEANEAFDKFSSMLEDGKKELLNKIKNIDDPDIDIGMIEDEDPLGIEVFLDDIIKDKNPLDDVRFKDLFKIRDDYDHNIQAAFKELAQESAQEFLSKIKGPNRTMIIETHSEHLLLRIMRRMRETFEDRIEENRFPVTPDDVAVLFVESHDSRTIIREMPVNERGDLVKAWPGGFFEEDMEEVLA